MGENRGPSVPVDDVDGVKVLNSADQLSEETS